MAAGWAVAFDAPFKWTKQVASDFGGTRNGMVAHWPEGIKQGGGMRTQFSHVIDIAPTVLEAAGLPEPKIVNGTLQVPMEGTSLAYTFNDAKAARASQHPVLRNVRQSRDLSRRLVCSHHSPRPLGYHEDAATGCRRLGSVPRWVKISASRITSPDKHPDKLEQMKDLFMIEAAKYNVLPIDDRTIERTNAAIAGRPDVMGGRTSLTLVRRYGRHDGEHLHEREEPFQDRHG